jgi:hypothetical protein
MAVNGTGSKILIVFYHYGRSHKEFRERTYA